MRILSRLTQGINHLPAIDFTPLLHHGVDLRAYLLDSFAASRAYGGQLKAQTDIAGLYTAAFLKTIQNTAPPPTQNYPPLPLPNGWMQEDAVADGTTVRFCSTNTPDAAANIIFALGFGTESPYFEQRINRFTARHINVITVELPYIGNALTFADGQTHPDKYRAILGNLLLSDHSPLWELTKGRKTLLLTHSASGLATLSNLWHSEEACDFAAQHYASIIHTAPMLDTANSSEHFEPVQSLLYDLYSRHPNVRDFPLGSTPLDQIFIARSLNLSPDDYLIGSHRVPTHGQARQLKQTGIELVRDTHYADTLSERFKGLNQVLIAGLSDGGACPKTIRLFGKRTGIQVHGIEGVRHNPVLECDITERFIFRRVAAALRAA